MNEPYSERDHSHCWNQKTPACGMAFHTRCCICEHTNEGHPYKGFADQVKELEKLFKNIVMNNDTTQLDNAVEECIGIAGKMKDGGVFAGSYAVPRELFRDLLEKCYGCHKPSELQEWMERFDEKFRTEQYWPYYGEVKAFIAQTRAEAILQERLRLKEKIAGMKLEVKYDLRESDPIKAFDKFTQMYNQALKDVLTALED